MSFLGELNFGIVCIMFVITVLIIQSYTLYTKIQELAQIKRTFDEKHDEIMNDLDALNRTILFMNEDFMEGLTNKLNEFIVSYPELAKEILDLQSDIMEQKRQFETKH